MMSDGQQQQEVGPSVTLAQPPATARSRFPKCPYIRTGVRLSNGCRIPGAIFVLFVLAGGIMVFLGILFMIIVPYYLLGGGTLAIIGVVVLIPGILLCMGARTQYKALLPEHTEGDTTPPLTPSQHNP